mmetsp:Transcript_44799/g.114531  ORF Transcript_44799/g.114531 Transcript_44799/m.114531 type:complete len:96 (+) Transcript_44799:185-472(+)
MVTASDGGPAPKRSVNVRSGPPLAAVALCGLLLAGPASALFPGWHDDDGADEVGVGIFVLNLGGIDALAGTFVRLPSSSQWAPALPRLLYEAVAH